MSDIAIKAEDVGKLYRLGQIGTGTISHDLNRWWAKVRGREDPFAKIGETNDRTKKGDSEYVWALKDIYFEIRKGEAVGIIGRNGAGKSTLLKLLSKVTKPTTGSISVNGRIASLLEVGTGFHPEMTGRENIYLNGAILGMTKKEITRKFDEIVDFSGVERYIDTPVKRYSSGMYVRLAFAVAAHLESEILIIDEVLAVGDAEFQKKCLGKMGDVSKGEGRTVLFVSHQLGMISQLCGRSILMRQGTVQDIGPTNIIIDKYIAYNEVKESVYNRKHSKENIFIKTILPMDENQNVVSDFKNNQDVYFEFTICKKELNDDKPYRLIAIIQDGSNKRIFADEIIITKEKHTLKINKNFLVRGDYSLTSIIYIPGVKQYDNVPEACYFNIIDASSRFLHLETFDYGIVFGNSEWV